MSEFNTMKVQAIQAAYIVETTYMSAVEFMTHYHATLNNSGCHWTFAIRQYLPPPYLDKEILTFELHVVFGQVIFGYLADVLGRKKMYGVELMIIISTTLAQSLCGESTAVSVVAVLIFCKLVY
jgi:hypothetical protein